MPLDRITPADAGKTVQHGNAQRRKQDHPRGCGENAMRCESCECFRGSPPRMRGKLFRHRVYGPFDGITPADAGKTQKMLDTLVSGGDHPRGCGENNRY